MFFKPSIPAINPIFLKTHISKTLFPWTLMQQTKALCLSFLDLVTTVNLSKWINLLLKPLSLLVGSLLHGTRLLFNIYGIYKGVVSKEFNQNITAYFFALAEQHGLELVKDAIWSLRTFLKTTVVLALVLSLIEVGISLIRFSINIIKVNCSSRAKITQDEMHLNIAKLL